MAFNITFGSDPVVTIAPVQTMSLTGLTVTNVMNDMVNQNVWVVCAEIPRKIWVGSMSGSSYDATLAACTFANISAALTTMCTGNALTFAPVS